MQFRDLLVSTRRAFTLIELLIVVAIIAILAAIAVPNFLEAQTRAKVSRARNDLRSIATALESYRVDNNQYPPTPFVSGGDVGVMRVIPDLLTTPIAYISSQFPDLFISTDVGDFQMITRTGNIVSWAWDTAYPYDPKDPAAGQRYYYQSNRDPRRSSSVQAGLLQFAVPTMGEWITASLGPNRRRDYYPGSTGDFLIPYDPTNGTVSGGDIVRTQKNSEGGLGD